MQRGMWTFRRLTLALVVIPLALCASSALAATLTVQSSPDPGVSITGTDPGVTPYAASVLEEVPITLTAPTEAGGLDFIQWSNASGERLADSRTITFSIGGAPTPPSQLYAGTAKVDITPDQAVIPTVPPESFRFPDVLPDPPVPPDNIHDPLYARVLVLQNSSTSVAIVSVDAILFSSKLVVDEAKRLWGVDHVVLSATHTHEGMVPREMCPTGSSWAWSFAPDDPGVSLDWPGFSNDPWWAATEQKIIAAIGEAMGGLFPARIASGKGPFESYYLSHNRRHINADGSVSMWWSNPDRLPTSPVDQNIRVIRVEDASGNARALMVHYASHPCIVMGDPMITADYPGAMADHIEQELGEECMAMYLNGAEGDIDPYEISQHGEYGFSCLQQAGTDLGQAALDLSATIPSPSDTDTSLQIKENMVTINYRDGTDTSEAWLTTIVINDDLAILTVPAEIFCQHQLNLAEQSPIENTFILGIAYSGRGSPYMIYIPTVEAVGQPGDNYGATRCSYVEAAAGDKMITQGLASIRSFVGDTTVVAEYAAIPDILYANDGVIGEPGSACTAIGDDANDGLSPGAPMRHIQALLDKYPDWGTGKTVWADPGTYVENISIGAGHSGLTLQGAGRDSTIINGNQAGSCLALTAFTGGAISDFTFSNGNAFCGGGMYVSASSLTVTDCAFTGNSASESYGGGGGGMYNDSCSSLTVTDCAFSGNSAGVGYGGGIYNADSSPTVTGCTFSNNSTGLYGGGMFNGDESSPTMTNCVFSGNSALFGGGIINHYSSATVTDCTFSDNSADFNSGAGGGIHNYHVPLLTLRNCIFRGNQAAWGGGMYNEGLSTSAVTNCTFTGNTANNSGGGMCDDNSTLTATNCILWGNAATSGEQIAFNSTNTSLTSTITVSYSDAQGGQGGVLTNPAAQDVLNWGSGNINSDPQFVSGEDAHLQATSPCIDSANGPAAPEFDIAGYPRQDAPVMPNVGNGPPWADMGAYEFQGDATTTTTTTLEGATTTTVASTTTTTAATTTTTLPSGGETIPGRIQAEEYDNGQPGGWWSNQTLPPDPEDPGNYNLGHLGQGTSNWVSYNVNVTAAGDYTFTVRVHGSGERAGDAHFHLEINDVNVTDTITIPNVYTWFTVAGGTVHLDAGPQVLKLAVDTEEWGTWDWNMYFNWIQVDLAAAPATTTTTSTTTTSTTSTTTTTLPPTTTTTTTTSTTTTSTTSTTTTVTLPPTTTTTTLPPTTTTSSTTSTTTTSTSTTSTTTSSTTTSTSTTTTTVPGRITVLYPSDAGTSLERGTKRNIEWTSDLPKGTKVKVELMKRSGGTWALTAKTKKDRLKWKVGKAVKGVEMYPDGDDYRIRVSTLNGSDSDESDSDFTIAAVESLIIAGATNVTGGSTAQYACTAHYTFGADRPVTNEVEWSCSKTPGMKMRKTGLLTTAPVAVDQPCTITAAYGKGKPPLNGTLDITIRP